MLFKIFSNMASNNFYLNSDPLLFGSSNSFNKTEEDIKNQLNDAIMQYKLLQQRENSLQQNYVKDYIGDLDTVVKNVGESTMQEITTNNSEYVKLHNELQEIVQYELLMLIKNKLNTNQTAITNIQKQIDIINNTKIKVDDEQRKNLSELNDYVKNYSNITFDDYKKLKKNNTEIITTNHENTRIKDEITRNSRKVN